MVLLCDDLGQCAEHDVVFDTGIHMVLELVTDELSGLVAAVCHDLCWNLTLYVIRHCMEASWRER